MHVKRCGPEPARVPGRIGGWDARSRAHRVRRDDGQRLNRRQCGQLPPQRGDPGGVPDTDSSGSVRSTRCRNTTTFSTPGVAGDGGVSRPAGQSHQANRTSTPGMLAMFKWIGQVSFPRRSGGVHVIMADDLEASRFSWRVMRKDDQ
jgi:hypothetical protein